MTTETPQERLTLPQQRSRETRQRILDGALSVFSRLGYGHASVDEVAREAGISKGALYHHFASKEDLFRALLKDRVKGCQEHMLSAVGEITSLPQAMRAAIGASFTSHHADPQWTPMLMEFWSEAVRDVYARSIVADSFRNCRQTVAQILRSGQAMGFVRPDLDADAVSVLYLAMVDGIRLQAQVDSSVDVEGAKDSMGDMIIEFVKPRSGGRERP